MMKTIIYPKKVTWITFCKRPGTTNENLDSTVKNILDDVRQRGDKALSDYSLKFDKTIMKGIKVSEQEIRESADKVSDDIKQAIDTAYRNIEKFHRAQLINEEAVETMPGVICRRKNVAIEKVGIYVPGGSAPLFSTVLMLVIPAKIAGCREIIMCTPPDKDGKINPLILYSALVTGVTDIYRVGGAQAVAALAYGTETIPRVDKIFGPGNRYVTRAKELVQAEGTAIDMPAGPSEVLVIADKYADPGFVAADLLAQAEHGPDSQVLMLTDDNSLPERVSAEIKKQAEQLPRKDIALSALENSLLIVLNSLEECIDFSNEYAPEHLIINTSGAAILAEKVINAGSVFIGEYSCESAGDYASGPNHTLPTNGFARSFSGLSTDNFVKKITFQELSSTGIKNIGPVVQKMAEAESLDGHKNAVTVRLKRLKND
jgi:histidinol dehydrogenase